MSSYNNYSARAVCSNRLTSPSIRSTTTTSAPPFFSIHSILFPLDAGHSPCRASQWSAGSRIVLRVPSSSCQSGISRTKDLELQHNFYLTKIGKTSWIFFKFPANKPKVRLCLHAPSLRISQHTAIKSNNGSAPLNIGNPPIQIKPIFSKYHVRNFTRNELGTLKLKCCTNYSILWWSIPWKDNFLYLQGNIKQK